MAEPVFTSVIRLIGCPEELRGHSVRVIGYCVLRFEGRAIYLAEADFLNAVTKNALWLDVDLKPEYTKLDGQYVLVEGTFDSDNRGHLQLYSGTVRDVKRMEAWTP